MNTKLAYKYLTKKTLIAILSSHDDDDKNKKLIDLLDEICSDKYYRTVLENYWFVFTGGTYDRIINGTENVKPVSTPTKDFLKSRTICLPKYQEGGVTILSYLVMQNKIKIIWPFFAGLTSHVLVPSNRSLLRLCDLYDVKQLINTGSIKEWLKFEAELDMIESRVSVPLEHISITDETKIKTIEATDCVEKISTSSEHLPDNTTPTLALIYDDEKSSETLFFAKTYETVIQEYFDRIIITETPNSINRIPLLKDKIIKCKSGHEGGYVELATEILFGRCDVAIFFLDPLQHHINSDYIQVVLSAGMINEQIRVLKSEKQASDWMDRVALKLIQK